MTMVIRVGMYYTIEFLDQMVKDSTEKIKALSRKDYKPWRVFVIFNKGG